MQACLFLSLLAPTCSSIRRYNISSSSSSNTHSSRLPPRSCINSSSIKAANFPHRLKAPTPTATNSPSNHTPFSISNSSTNSTRRLRGARTTTMTVARAATALPLQLLWRHPYPPNLPRHPLRRNWRCRKIRPRRGGLLPTPTGSRTRHLRLMALSPITVVVGSHPTEPNLTPCLRRPWRRRAPTLQAPSPKAHFRRLPGRPRAPTRQARNPRIARIRTTATRTLPLPVMSHAPRSAEWQQPSHVPRSAEWRKPPGAVFSAAALRRSRTQRKPVTYRPSPPD